MKKYNIKFGEAMNLLLEGKWLRGDNFKDGCYIKLDHIGRLVLVDVNMFGHEEPYPYIRSLYGNRYRIITIATINELKD